VAPKCRRCGFPFRVQACVRDQCQGARPRTSCETYPASNCPVSLASGDSPRTQQAALIRQRVIQGLQPFCNRIRAALQPLCNRATTEQPRTRVKPSLRRPASSGRFAAVRGRSRSVNQSGRPDLNRGPHRGGRDTVRARAGPRPAREEIGANGSNPDDTGDFRPPAMELQRSYRTQAGRWAPPNPMYAISNTRIRKPTGPPARWRLQPRRAGTPSLSARSRALAGPAGCSWNRKRRSRTRHVSDRGEWDFRIVRTIRRRALRLCGRPPPPARQRAG
jgi:hypothetical protein